VIKGPPLLTQGTGVAPADVVLTFLESLGRRSEAELYLKLFHKLPKESFAIIAPGAPVLRYGLGSVVEQLRFLADLDLAAPVLLGLFDPETGATSSERLVKRLPAVGLEASPHAADEPDVWIRVRDELRTGRVPILHFSPAEGMGLRERLTEVAELCGALGTRKFVLLRRRGGLGKRSEKLPEAGDRAGQGVGADNGKLSVINLHTAQAFNKVLPKRDFELLETARQLIDQVEPLPLLVSVTSPLNLLKELFTVKGAGTLIKRGAQVQRFHSYEDLDPERLRALLQSSFQKPLEEGFFDKPPVAVYLDAEYRGAAILTTGSHVPYLSKFAVLPEAQGEGIGNDLWFAMSRDFPSLYWRTRPDNSIGAWYATVCDGMVRRKQWHVFWRGLDPSRIPEIIADAEARPADFKPPGESPAPAP
jgi:acetylglutamate kinase